MSFEADFVERFPVVKAVVISEERCCGRIDGATICFRNISSCRGVILRVVCRQQVILLHEAMVQ